MFGFEEIVDSTRRQGGFDALEQDCYGLTALAAAGMNGHVDIAEKVLGTTQGLFHTPDMFGRSLLRWRGKTGNEQLEAVLRSEAKLRQAPLLNLTESARQISASIGEYGRGYCEVYTAPPALENVNWYSCVVYLLGNFRLCQNCLAIGASCPEPYHAINGVPVCALAEIHSEFCSVSTCLSHSF